MRNLASLSVSVVKVKVHGGIPGHLLGEELELEGGGRVEVHEVGDGARVGRLHGVILHLHFMCAFRALAHFRGFIRRLFYALLALLYRI